MPSQIKVDEIKNVAGQYKIKTNVLEGQTTASSITVQGEGTATTNLQQGLCKFWTQTVGSGTVSNNDSFNSSGLTDNGTGDYTHTFTNAMGNNDYSVTGSQGGNTSNDEVRIPQNAGDFATDSFQVNTLKTGVALNDSEHVCTQVAGDLA